ncbi:MAG TPA: FprA family A-type flavoprotein [Bacilli bacterium]|nr:FprA family A-type flavoprotein [Bacilli bacterium]
MAVFKVINNVYSIGVLDKDLRVFDIMMETKLGTTYNSYLILNDGEAVIIDGVKAPFTDEWLRNIESLVPFSRVKALITQHTEPDHSGSIPALLEKNPKIKIYGSFMAMQNLKEIANFNFDANVVKPGEELKLTEAQTLVFHPVPNVHWPDTIITHDPMNNLAYTCDFLGMHIAPENLFLSKEKNKDLALEALTVYYEAIMAPFKGDVLRAVNVLKKLDVAMVLNSHGYILDKREDVDSAINKYIEWSTIPKASNLVVTIAFASAYGYTKMMVDEVVSALEESGATVYLFEVPTTPLEVVTAAVERSDALLVASPTFVGDGIKPIYDVLNSLNPFIANGKYFSAFGSFGWSGEAVRNYLSRAKELRFKTVDEGHKERLKPTKEQLLKTKEYIKNFITVVKGELNKA